jgi:diguanylate cyclase (GGDEF)-like protein
MLIALALSALGLAALLSFARLLSGPDAAPFILGTSVLTIVGAAAVARRVHGFPSVLCWGVAAVGAMYAVIMTTAGALPVRAGVGSADVIDLGATVAIIAMTARVVHRRRGGLTVGDVLDGLIITGGTWMVSWILFVEPFVRSGAQPTAALVLNAIYLPVAVPLVTLAALLVVGAGRPTPAVLLLATGLLLLVFGDLVHAVDATRTLDGWAYTLADVSTLFAVGACAAALIHPSAPSLLSVSATPRDHALPGRLTVTVGLLVAPVVLLAFVAGETATDRWVRTVSAFATLGFVGIRLYTATHAQVRSQQALVRAARTDELTGLHNKRALLAAATDHIDEAWTTRERPSFYLFDLDGFKNINDASGHALGDEILCTVADRLRLAAQGMSAVVARPSGDEFVVFDPTPKSEDEAMRNASALHSVFARPISTSRGEIVVTSTCGVACMRAGSPTPAEELLRWADIAMYRAKERGRNGVVLYEQAMQERAASRMTIEHSLRGALERRELVLFHQPIIDVARGTVDGVEALMRWRRGDGSLMPPVDFISIAEETGIIDEIGAWAILEALTQLRHWIDDGVVPESTTMSVNVSPHQLSDIHFPARVREALSRSRVPADLLWLEVTENVMIENTAAARASLDQLRSIGVRIALDDFGTGYSSLSLLQDFPVQRIKIDRAFVDTIAEPGSDSTLVRTIIGLGDSMGVDIVAEGVETVLQLRALRELGCAKAQGFLISHPVPAEAMRSTVGALDGLAQWPEFNQLMGDSSLQRFPGRNT